MDLLLHDTQRGKKVKFEPLDPLGVRMYVCGPTVYDRPHVGNARPAVVFDVVFRLLRHLYGADHVIYASNFTDIDDKIIRRAAERGIPIDALTQETAEQYRQDIAALGVLEPTHRPRATEHIPDMLWMIETLIQKGHAYAAEGHVLFAVATDPNPNRLHGHKAEDLIAGARVKPESYKRDPQDFILWKPSTPEQPGWDSPWGRGRPGWHIECSAMIEALLGIAGPKGFPLATIDIHGGGADLMFPHHENECRQSECTTGQPLAQHWLHSGMILSEGKKMAKSAGNFVTVRDVLDRGVPGEVLRMLILQTHYRQPLDFTWGRIAEAKATLDRFYRALEVLWEYADENTPEPTPPAMLVAKLCDDLNTPEVLQFINRIADNAFKAHKWKEKSRLRGNLLGIGQILGLFTVTPAEWFRGSDTGTDAAEVERLIAQRNEHRGRREFAEADAIRQTLADQGIVLEDLPAGTVWRKA